MTRRMRPRLRGDDIRRFIASRIPMRGDDRDITYDPRHTPNGAFVAVPGYLIADWNGETAPRRALSGVDAQQEDSACRRICNRGRRIVPHSVPHGTHT